MKFNLTSPCAHCPFRTDIQPYLRWQRAREIVGYILTQDKTFACHETTREDARGSLRAHRNSSHCAGALILHEKAGRPNWLIRFAAGLGIFDPTRLKMRAPVFSSGSRMIAKYKGASA